MVEIEINAVTHFSSQACVLATGLPKLLLSDIFAYYRNKKDWTARVKDSRAKREAGVEIRKE